MGELQIAGGRERAPKLAERLAAAGHAYERDRFQDALRISRSLVEEAPGSAAVRELHGLACYRLGRWRDAVRHLQASIDLSGDVSQIPALMDCCRALGRYRQVETQWDRLRQASSSAEVLVEGRMVLAATLADRGDLGAAIALLNEAGASRTFRNPAERHLRQWYLLGDLYERAGDTPKARDFFTRVVAADPELTDAAERLGGLGRAPRKTSTASDRAAARKAAAEDAQGSESLSDESIEPIQAESVESNAVTHSTPSLKQEIEPGPEAVVIDDEDLSSTNSNAKVSKPDKPSKEKAKAKDKDKETAKDKSGKSGKKSGKDDSSKPDKPKPYRPSESGGILAPEVFEDASWLDQVVIDHPEHAIIDRPSQSDEAGNARGADSTPQEQSNDT